MNTIQIKKHFVESEFLTSETIPEKYRLSRLEEMKIKWWIDILSPIRDMLDFPITVTDGLRVGNGTSQHFFQGDGAVDIRPSDRENSNQFLQLALVLCAHPQIFRVCYYKPSKRFPNGAFHCDRKGAGLIKKLFINHNKEINWKPVFADQLILEVSVHKSDLKVIQ